jgi:hypothetical protein
MKCGSTDMSHRACIRVWTRNTTSHVKKFKSQPAVGNRMVIVFWDLQGPALEHYKEGGVMINSEMLHDMLKLVIRSRHSDQLSECAVLSLYGSSHPHTAAHCE